MTDTGEWKDTIARGVQDCVSRFTGAISPFSARGGRPACRSGSSPPDRVGKEALSWPETPMPGEDFEAAPVPGLAEWTGSQREVWTGTASPPRTRKPGSGLRRRRRGRPIRRRSPTKRSLSPPAAMRSTEYGAPSTPSGNGSETGTSVLGRTINESDFVAPFPLHPVTRRVNRALPGACTLTCRGRMFTRVRHNRTGSAPD